MATDKVAIFLFQRVETTHQCVDCFDFLCEECSAAHQRTRQTHGHVVLKLSDILKGSPELEMKKRSRLPCANHTQNALELYCMPCEKVYLHVWAIAGLY